jgi:hypothetical protein
MAADELWSEGMAGRSQPIATSDDTNRQALALKWPRQVLACGLFTQVGMLGKISMFRAIAATLLVLPTTLSAQAPDVGPSVRGGVGRGIAGPLPPPGARGVVVERGGPIVRRRYHGGTWGAGRRF